MTKISVPLEISYDPIEDLVTIEGIRYAPGVFRGLGGSIPLLPVGARFEVVERRDGVVSLRTLTEPSDLSIGQISRINLSRCLRWHPDGLHSWSYSDWHSALAGEAGELVGAICLMGDTIKKLNRFRDGLVGNKKTPKELLVDLRKEVADVYLYLDLFAQRAGIDLAEAVRAKFNEVSERNDFPERL